MHSKRRWRLWKDRSSSQLKAHIVSPVTANRLRLDWMQHVNVWTWQTPGRSRSRQGVMASGSLDREDLLAGRVAQLRPQAVLPRAPESAKGQAPIGSNLLRERSSDGVRICCGGAIPSLRGLSEPRCRRRLRHEARPGHRNHGSPAAQRVAEFRPHRGLSGVPRNAKGESPAGIGPLVHRPSLRVGSAQHLGRRLRKGRRCPARGGRWIRGVSVYTVTHRPQDVTGRRIAADCAFGKTAAVQIGVPRDLVPRFDASRDRVLLRAQRRNANDTCHISAVDGDERKGKCNGQRGKQRHEGIL